MHKGTIVGQNDDTVHIANRCIIQCIDFCNLNIEFIGLN